LQYIKRKNTAEKNLVKNLKEIAGVGIAEHFNFA